MYILNKKIPHVIRAQFVAPIYRAYQVSEIIKAQFPLLDGPMYCNVMAILRQTLVEHELQRIIEKGTMNGLKCRISNNQRSTHPFLEIFGDSFSLTISHTQKENILPPGVYFRNERAAISGQISFFEDDCTFDEYTYFILTHGHNKERPDFINIGIPDYNKKMWIEKINILTEPYIITDRNKYEEEESLVSLTELAKEVIKSEVKKVK